MRTPRVLYHIVRADFLERSRSYTFLILLCLCIYLGYAINTGKLVLRFNTCAEIFDSAWVGALVAIAINFFLGFFGFFLVKGSIERDGRTGVGQIMAATPLQRIEYTFGKWLSNFILLSIFVIILAVGTVLIQIFRLDGLDPVVLLSPFFWLTLPFMALVAAVAVLFETMPWIKGGLSSVIYFSLFVFLLITVTNSSSSRGMTLADPSGIRILLQEIKSAGLDCGAKTSLSELTEVSSPVTLSAGIAWSADVTLSRVGVFAMALALTSISASFFNRFDSSGDKLRKPRNPKDHEIPQAEREHILQRVKTPVHLTSLATEHTYRSNVPQIILAELRLVLKGNHWIWYIGAAVLWIFSFFASEKSMTLWLIILAIWPLLIWSKLGIREAYFRTNQIVFACAHPMLRLLFATWFAGVLITAALWSGAGLHFALHNQMVNLIGWSIAVLLVPSFALMLGTWTGSSKVFEVVYLVIWYAGIANRLPALDFMGLTTEAIAIQHPAWVFILLSVCLLLASIGRRQHQHI
ncbi:MAG: hypothetical protein EHM33_27980 [Chloroflexi bacterium]|nr:MAG: hypothetical protein EHM33_27980 [Chloroflexota bacterium]